MAIRFDDCEINPLPLGTGPYSVGEFGAARQSPNQRHKGSGAHVAPRVKSGRADFRWRDFGVFRSLGFKNEATFPSRRKRTRHEAH